MGQLIIGGRLECPACGKKKPLPFLGLAQMTHRWAFRGMPKCCGAEMLWMPAPGVMRVLIGIEERAREARLARKQR